MITFRHFSLLRPTVLWPTTVTGEQDCGWGGRQRWILALVDIQVGPSETLTILCACRKLHVWFSVVYQTDLLREGFACDAEVTHSLSFFSSPWLPDRHWWSYLWRLHHLRELGPVSRSLFPQVRKISSHWKVIRWIFIWAPIHSLIPLFHPQFFSLIIFSSCGSVWPSLINSPSIHDTKIHKSSQNSWCNFGHWP